MCRGSRPKRSRAMIEDLLARDEGKTLEFKENCRPLDRIVRTAVAFANTAGGSIVIGVKDKTREVTGVADPLTDEGRLANAFAEGIRPLLIPDIQVQAWRNCQVLVVTVPHAVGPYFVRSEGPEAGVYVRLGSSNRPAGPDLVAEIRRLARNTSFDEQPCPEASSEDVDFRAASELFARVTRPLTP
ncbi:MAG: transcriptional regulator, partial [Planctomycetes bacterium]|nr:transcriptional regulator [Planctomycetota bacterium]